MKLLLALSLALCACSAMAQSLTLGYTRSTGAFTALEIPAYQFSSHGWSFATDGFLASRIGASKGIGVDLALSHRFSIIKALGLPVASAWWTIGVGPVLFAGERRPRLAGLVGLQVRVGQ